VKENKMGKSCNNCSATESQALTKVTMSSADWQRNEQRHEKREKRLWIALIVAVAMLFASNMGWLIYESQFVTVSYEQDGDGVNNVNVGEQGDINNGAESQDKVQEEK
jgi:hypothetical protein